MRIKIVDDEKFYEFSDVFIRPQYSDIMTRQEVDTSVTFKCRDGSILKISVPIMSANMKDVTEAGMCNALHRAGAIGALHRFMTIEENVRMFRAVDGNCLVSVGVNRDSHERAEALINAGAKYFIIDIAHGHSKYMGDMLDWFEKLPDRNSMLVVAGNVSTPDGVEFLRDSGADVIKVGVGPGAVCLTKNVTGVTTPQFSAIYQCSRATNTPLIADGGLAEYGDIAKAIGVGAAMCMSGKFFANCVESSALRTHEGKVIYRGSASKTVQEDYRNAKQQMPTPEGKSMALEGQNVTGDVVNGIAGGLRSAFSYVGARSMKEFQSKCDFGVRHNKS